MTSVDFSGLQGNGNVFILLIPPADNRVSDFTLPWIWSCSYLRLIYLPSSLWFWLVDIAATTTFSNPRSMRFIISKFEASDIFARIPPRFLSPQVLFVILLLQRNYLSVLAVFVSQLARTWGVILVYI